MSLNHTTLGKFLVFSHMLYQVTLSNAAALIFITASLKTICVNFMTLPNI